MKAAARIERTGVPIDLATLESLKGHWDSIQERLVSSIDRSYGVFEGTSFKRRRWESWLAMKDIPWPRLESGQLALDDDTFRQMARLHPAVAPIRELRYSLSKMRLSGLAVGPDGRNRCILSAFRSRTGRNQPSNSRFCFGPAVWIRGLIKPEPDMGIAYVDWSQQEFGIAAALSGDAAMLEAYRSGDPYLAFAKQAGAAPADATKASHASVREQFKQCVLGVQYAMGEGSLAVRIAQPPIAARSLLRAHHRTYPKFWRWSDAAVDQAMLHGVLWTTFGWRVRRSAVANPRSMRNFPMQANGAEMLRLACIFATESGVSVCAPVHDALLIEAPIRELDDAVEQVQFAMARASRLVLDGFELRTDAQRWVFPERYEDPRGKVMWDTVMGILEAMALEGRAA